jgi:hypothetical protein
MFVVKIEDSKGNLIAVFPAKETEFKTGSRGYRGISKVDGPEGKRYQTSVQLVEIHSKPGTADAEQDETAATE